MSEIKTDGRDCMGCKLWIDLADHCAIRDLDGSDYCPCRLCPVKVMCNGRIKECPLFLEHIKVEREKTKNEKQH